MGNNNAWILVIVAVVLGFSAGFAVARWGQASEGQPPAGPSAVLEPTQAGRAELVASVDRIVTDTCHDTDAKLEQCHAALMASWANASHPIEVAELDSSFDAATRFADAYYADDDPEVVRERLAGEALSGRLEDLLAGHDIEMDDVHVSCDPLPCVMEVDLTYTGDGDASREALDPLFGDLKGALGDAVTGDLEGYHAVQPDFSWGQDPAQRTFHTVVTSHSQDEMDTLVESMILFAEEVLGNKRFE